MEDRHLRLVQPNQQQGHQNEMFNEMLRGYATMLLAAGRDRGSVGKLLQMLRGFVVWADAWPWEWTARDVDEWSADMRDRELALSTLRNRQGVVRRFCEYAVNLRRCAATWRTSARSSRTGRGYGRRSDAMALVGSSRSACVPTRLPSLLVVMPAVSTRH